MEDAIADALKNHDQIDQGNIEKALNGLALRGIHVDRCENKFELQFVRSGLATYFGSPAFSTSDREIPIFEEFHEQATEFFGAFTVEYRNTANTLQKADARFIGESTFPVFDLYAAPTETAQEFDKCTFEGPESDAKSIEEFGSREIPKSNTKIVLRGRSKWILKRLKENLEDFGYKSVTVDCRPVKYSCVLWTTYHIGQLQKAIFTHKNIANFVWGIAGLIAGFVVRQLTL